MVISESSRVTSENLARAAEKHAACLRFSQVEQLAEAISIARQLYEDAAAKAEPVDRWHVMGMVGKIESSILRVVGLHT